MKIYCTSYCNKGHYLKNGRPVNHECRIIPPAALQAERDGNFDLAIRLMESKPDGFIFGHPVKLPPQVKAALPKVVR